VPGYTIRNLKSVEDSAVTHGLAPDVEARFARRALESERSGLSYQRLAPNVRQAFGHRHREQEETYVVVGGSGRVKLEDDVVEVAPWDAVRVAPQTTRCFEAGPDGMEFLAFGAHPSADDSEVLPGWWLD
jgi:mannose-6-phosphate isomerase-like protein (cupin superfamily)